MVSNATIRYSGTSNLATTVSSYEYRRKMSRITVPPNGRVWEVAHGDRFKCTYCKDEKERTMSSMVQHLSQCQTAKAAKMAPPKVALPKQTFAHCPSCNLENPDKVFKCSFPGCSGLICSKVDDDGDMNFFNNNYGDSGCWLTCDVEKEERAKSKDCRGFFCSQHSSWIIDRPVCKLCMDVGLEISDDYWD